MASRNKPEQDEENTLSKLSGWCSPWCSPKTHATCQERLEKGWLDTCDCEKGHPMPGHEADE